MPQAIITRYLPCAMRKPARVKATGSGNPLKSRGAPFAMVPYYQDDCEGGYWAHKRAAEAFARKYHWGGNWSGQEMRNGNWIFVCDPKISFTVGREFTGKPHK